MNKIMTWSLASTFICIGICFFIYPASVFKKAMQYRGIILYAQSGYPGDKNDLKKVLDSALDHLSGRILIADEAPAKVFLTNSATAFSIMSSGRGRSFAANSFFGTIVAPSDPRKDSVWSSTSEYNRRRLSDVLAHELVHEYIRQRLGFFNYRFRLPDWKNEGYADYIAGSSSYPEKLGLEMIRQDQTDPSQSFRYFTYRMTMKYILEEESVGFDSLLLNERDFDFWFKKYQIKLKALP